MSEKTLIIKSFLNEAEAEIARGLLKSSGIKSFISKDDVGGMYPGMQTTATGVHLRVRPKDAGRAEDILKSTDASDKYHDDEIRSKSLKAVISIFAWFFVVLGVSLLLIGIFNKNSLIYFGMILVVVGGTLEVLFCRNKLKSQNRKHANSADR